MSSPGVLAGEKRESMSPGPQVGGIGLQMPYQPGPLGARIQYTEQQVSLGGDDWHQDPLDGKHLA